MVANVIVKCRAVAPDETETEVIYTFVPLTAAGQAAIDAMTQADYEAKMKRWSSWIGQALRPGVA